MKEKKTIWIEEEKVNKGEGKRVIKRKNIVERKSYIYNNFSYLLFEN